MIIATVVAYFVLLAIIRVLSEQGNKFDQFICYSVLIGFVILMILAIIQQLRDSIEISKLQQKWKCECKSVKVAIIDRKYHPDGSYEDGYGIPHSFYSSYQLNLESTIEQRALYPNLISISVDVSEIIYSKVKDRNIVQIYYKPASPMEFLLDEEFE